MPGSTAPGRAVVVRLRTMLTSWSPVDLERLPQRRGRTVPRDRGREPRQATRPADTTAHATGTSGHQPMSDRHSRRERVTSIIFRSRLDRCRS
ncbi:hypothetical protein FRACA_1900006 [Frankia canadensis]|uniref:Uncharacterized protein n=1 Tax=Frankia canadensis TaxID=1836972 RepID=A0A2I2KP88_9ACTN|nr:hypothetical protein FRACA_1900006 [Frankia canadensis]SOU54777.1 hypothetical protein FRACA_1900006 [Frankia canadensis]